MRRSSYKPEHESQQVFDCSMKQGMQLKLRQKRFASMLML